MSQDTTILFFGCINRAGHYLWLPNLNKISESEAHNMKVPTARQLDNTCFFLPRPEKVGTSQLTYLPAPDLSVLAWWGNNPWDKRGAVNSAIITNGELGTVAMWQRFVRYFPDLSVELSVPQTTGDSK